MAAARNALGWYVAVIRSAGVQGSFFSPCNPAPARCVSVWLYSIVYLTRTYCLRESGYSSVHGPDSRPSSATASR